MSCILCLQTQRAIYLGADSASTASDGFQEIDRGARKIYYIGELLCGDVGDPRLGQLFRYHTDRTIWKHIGNSKSLDLFLERVVTLLVPALRDLFTSQGLTNEDTSFIICASVGVVVIHESFAVTTHSGNTGLGSGAEIGLGALELSIGGPKTRLENSLAVSAKYSAYVRGPFDIFTLKKTPL